MKETSRPFFLVIRTRDRSFLVLFSVCVELFKYIRLFYTVMLPMIDTLIQHQNPPEPTTLDKQRSTFL